jgi:DNA-binding CsgD family transcriptional regulator
VLLLPLARRAARSVEHRLLDGWSTRDRVLNEAFLRARRRTRGPLALVNDRTLLTNAAAARIFSAADRSSMWDTVQRTVGSRDDSATFVSGDGATLVGEIDLLLEGDAVIGALIHFSARNERRSRRTTGWDSLTEAERALAHLIAQGMTNREAAVQLFVSHHTVDSHLRHIFRKLGIDSRVQLAGLVGAAPAPPAELSIQ